MKNPVCECGNIMVEHASGQESFFMCEECMSDERGYEVDSCPYCGTFSPWGSAPFCDCEDYEDETLDWEDEEWIYDERFEKKEEYYHEGYEDDKNWE